jgi:hypothetical protein
MISRPFDVLSSTMLTGKNIGCSGCSLLTEELRQIGFKLYTGDVERSLVSVLIYSSHREFFG